MKLSTLSFDFETVQLDQFGDKIERQRVTAKYFNEPLKNGIALEMVSIPGGTAQIGSPEAEEYRSEDEHEQHSITLDSFFIGKYPITQAQWSAVSSLSRVRCSLPPNPSKYQGLNRPVEQVSWVEANEFCARVSEISEKIYRLPTEAEWEYACRASTHTPFYFGETLTTDFANYCGENYQQKRRTGRSHSYIGCYGQGPLGIARNATTNVGHFNAPNTFGLYDFHGNVWEWCSSDSGISSSNVDATTQYQKPLRGGSWMSSPAACRAAARLLSSPGCQSATSGFRVVHSPGDGNSRLKKSEEASVSQSILPNATANNITIGNVTQVINYNNK